MSAEFFQRFREGILNDVNTGLVAKVLSYNPATKRAKVEPLHIVEGKPLSVLEEVPVLRHVEHLEIGSIVYLSIAKYSLDDALKGRKTEVYKRRFTLRDAVIVGVF